MLEKLLFLIINNSISIEKRKLDVKRDKAFRYICSCFSLSIQTIEALKDSQYEKNMYVQ